MFLITSYAGGRMAYLLFGLSWILVAGALMVVLGEHWRESYGNQHIS